MIDNVIEIKNLIKDYGKFKLGPLNLSIPKGSIVGYIGENGAGKTTTLKLILGLRHLDAGQIEIFGKTLKEQGSQVMNRIGVVFDDLHFPEEMTVKEVARLCKMTFDTWQESEFYRYLKKFYIFENQKVGKLSRGMKMQVSLATALSHQADLLILDEPTSGLDPVVRDEILDILMDFIQDENHTVFISSHILSDLEKVADYIALLHEGKLVFMEEKDRLLESYGLCSVDEETLEALDPAAIVGRRKTAFGQNLLVKRDLMPNGMEMSKPRIEDIMVYIIKGEDK